MKITPLVVVIKYLNSTEREKIATYVIDMTSNTKDKRPQQETVSGAEAAKTTKVETKLTPEEAKRLEHKRIETAVRMERTGRLLRGSRGQLELPSSH